MERGEHLVVEAPLLLGLLRRAATSGCSATMRATKSAAVRVPSVATAGTVARCQAGPVTADRLAAGDAALARADEAFARFDVDGILAHLSTAVRELTAAGDNRRAAVACARLGDMIATVLGNLPASRAWFARARRLVADEPPCIEQGWVAVAGMGCEVDDPAELLAASRAGPRSGSPLR